jgi:hypothetical protein
MPNVHPVKPIAAYFINVDLDLKSSADLSPLLKAWTNQVTPHHVPKDGRRNWVRLTLTEQTRDPAHAILGFCKLVRRLPSAGRLAWKKASTKEFDIGLQAGFESRAAEWVLHSTVIEAVRDVGARIRLTVYSPLPLLEEEKQLVRRLETAASTGNRIARVSVNAEFIRAYLIDGLMISMPIASSYRLSNATRAQRANWQLIGGLRIYWPDIDEDLSVDRLLDGIPVRRSEGQSAPTQRPANLALQPTNRAQKKPRAKGRRRAVRG